MINIKIYCFIIKTDLIYLLFLYLSVAVLKQKCERTISERKQKTIMLSLVLSSETIRPATYLLIASAVPLSL